MAKRETPENMVVIRWQNCWTRVHNTWHSSVCGVAQVFRDWKAPQGNINVNDIVNVGVQVFQEHCIRRFLHILHITHMLHILHSAHTLQDCIGRLLLTEMLHEILCRAAAHCSVVPVLELALCSGQSGLKVLALGWGGATLNPPTKPSTIKLRYTSGWDQWVQLQTYLGLMRKMSKQSFSLSASKVAPVLLKP